MYKGLNKQLIVNSRIFIFDSVANCNPQKRSQLIVIGNIVNSSDNDLYVYCAFTVYLYIVPQKKKKKNEKLFYEQQNVKMKYESKETLCTNVIYLE